MYFMYITYYYTHYKTQEEGIFKWPVWTGWSQQADQTKSVHIDVWLYTFYMDYYIDVLDNVILSE